MKVFSLLLVLMVALQGECFHRHTVPTAAPGLNAGDPCTPSTPVTCGRAELLGRTSAPETGMVGPNVCRFTKNYQIGTRTHSVQQWCFWGRCRLQCRPNTDCSGPMVNFTRNRTDCCEGFTTAASSSDSDYYYRHHHHHRNSIFRNEGCPVALMATVVDCLESVNATTFQSFISSAPELLETLSSDDSRVTVFAPTNEAIEGLDATVLAELFGGGAAEVTLSAHVPNSTLPSTKLVHGSVLRTLAENRFLHVAEVQRFQRRGYFRVKVGERTFVNGAEVVVKDACQARNGIVHVVDSVIPSSDQTIAEQLGEDSQFSIFKDLLDASGISVYLNRSNPRTVFAPTDEAFQQLPNGVAECLKMESNRRALNRLVLLHIAYPAEYTSSLCLRSTLSTFLWPIYLRVQCINDTVHITRDEIPLAEGADRPAKNGVFHAIGEVIVPDSVNLESICPDLQPTTQPTSPTVSTPDPEPSMIPTASPDPGPGVPIGSGDVVTGFPVDYVVPL